MRTTCKLLQGSSADLESLGVEDESVDLVVTSPPYPMVSMWDEQFSLQDPSIAQDLVNGCCYRAFESMHLLLDEAWDECDRVLKPGGIICINIGDAVRTIDDKFRMFNNRERVLSFFFNMDYASLPGIAWSKPTNAPNKFMGSGMLPVGAYVTLEHEHILILRKGTPRAFATPEEKQRRRESAYFWEERNLWFSDVWTGINGTAQKLPEGSSRERSGAFPIEIAYRLISMFSIKEDVALDPFAGTGTTVVAAMAAGRNGIGVELDASMVMSSWDRLLESGGLANSIIEKRLYNHQVFMAMRPDVSKHVNVHHGFGVVTAQEKHLLLNEVRLINKVDAGVFQVTHNDGPELVPASAYLKTEML